MVWMAYFVFACGSPWAGWVREPACILYFLLGVTGIPMTESNRCAAKGGYRRYQQQTSAFVPCPEVP